MGPTKVCKCGLIAQAEGFVRVTFADLKFSLYHPACLVAQAQAKQKTLGVKATCQAQL